MSAPNAKAFPLANAQLTNQILDVVQQASHVSFQSRFDQERSCSCPSTSTPNTMTYALIVQAA